MNTPVRCPEEHLQANHVPLPPSREEASNAALVCLGRHVWQLGRTKSCFFPLRPSVKKVEVSGKSLFFLPVFPQVCLVFIFRFCFHLEQESFASAAIRNVAWLVCKCEMVAEAALSPVNLGRLPGPISSLKKMSAILQNILKLSFLTPQTRVFKAKTHEGLNSLEPLLDHGSTHVMLSG